MRPHALALLALTACGPADEGLLWRKIDGSTLSPARFAIIGWPTSTEVVLASTDENEGLLLAEGDDGAHELGFRISQPGAASVQIDTRFGNDMPVRRAIYGFNEVKLAFPLEDVPRRTPVYLAVTRGPLEVWSFWLDVPARTP